MNGIKVVIEIDENSHDGCNAIEDFMRSKLLAKQCGRAILFIRVNVGCRRGELDEQTAQKTRLGDLIVK